VGTLKTREWKMREWKTWHQNARMANIPVAVSLSLRNSYENALRG